MAAAAREQASGIEQVNKAILQMDQATQQNAALVEETAAASQAMGDQAQGTAHADGLFYSGCRIEKNAHRNIGGVNRFRAVALKQRTGIAPVLAF
jgi:methyl-accepting chemotaxis protein